MQSVMPAMVAGDSAWHRMDPRWKVAGVLLTLVPLASIHTVAGAGLSFLLSAVLLASAALPFRWWGQRLAGVGLFLLLVVCLLPLSLGPKDWSWGGIDLSSAGVRLALIILFKALAATALALLLFGTTTVERILHAATNLKTPQPVIRLLLVCWRYVQVMHQVISEFRIALRLRGFRNRANWRTYRTISRVIGTLIVQGFERAERSAQAMHCRAYHGKVVTLETFRTRPLDVGLFAALLAAGWLGIAPDLINYFFV